MKPSRLKRIFVVGMLTSSFAMHAYSSTSDATLYRRETSLGPAATAAVVFTGGPRRIREGVEMYMRGEVDHLLLSGVHKSLTPEKLLRAMNIEKTRDLSGITLDYNSQTTEQNAAATAKWANKLRPSSLVLITSAEHMPRAVANFERLNRFDTRLYIKPVNAPLSPWAQARERVKIVATRMGLRSFGTPLRGL